METLQKPAKEKLPKPPKPPKPKGLALQQLANKQFSSIESLTPDFISYYGEIDEALDIIFFGDSSNGKTYAVAALVENLVAIFKCKCNYISYEEGHGKTMQNLLIDQYKLLEKHGNCLTLYEDFTYEQLDYYIQRKQSAKIWVFDSLQASNLTFEQMELLKHKYVMGKAKKIFIYISWAEGKLPQGAVARSVRYMANIKIRVEGFIAFIRSRYPNNKRNYVIWEEGAKLYWMKQYKKMLTKK